MCATRWGRKFPWIITPFGVGVVMNVCEWVWDGWTRRRWCEHGGCRCLCLWWVWGRRGGGAWWNVLWRFPRGWAWSLVEPWKRLLWLVRSHFRMRLTGLCRWGGTPYLYRVLIFRVQDRVALWVFPLEGPSRRVGCQRSIVWLRWHWGWFDCCLRLCWLWLNLGLGVGVDLSFFLFDDFEKVAVDFDGSPWNVFDFTANDGFGAFGALYVCFDAL